MTQRCLRKGGHALFRGMKKMENAFNRLDQTANTLICTACGANASRRQRIPCNQPSFDSKLNRGKGQTDEAHSFDLRPWAGKAATCRLRLLFHLWIDTDLNSFLFATESSSSVLHATLLSCFILTWPLLYITVAIYTRYPLGSSNLPPFAAHFHNHGSFPWAEFEAGKHLLPAVVPGDASNYTSSPRLLCRGCSGKADGIEPPPPVFRWLFHPRLWSEW